MDCRLLVVWDGARIHRSRLVWDFVREQKGRLWLESPPGLRSGTESGRVSLVALETARVAELVPYHLWTVEPLRPQIASPHATASRLSLRFLGAGGTVSFVSILCNAQ